jgi:single-strand DNA-binding protein
MSDTGDTITITGNVATPPELKQTPAGVAITTFRVASGQRRYSREAGGWTDAGTNWYTVSVFRTLAEHAHRSLQKGDRVILTGRLRLREWDNGTRRGTAVEIDADAIGHDLRWGTTTFEKDSRTATIDTSQNWATVPAGDEWAAPGVEGAHQAGEGEEALKPVLLAVGSGAGSAGDDVETPF